jgi:23S rRNA (uracil1939-C5)-methyltransferase
MDEQLDVTCGPMVAGGDALVRRSGEPVVFVEGGLPGEQVRVAVTQRKRDLLKARAVEVLAPSPDRTAPPCPMFAKGCGGCQWQHATVDAQHRYKTDIVIDALTRIAKIDAPPVRFGGAITPEDYRTTMRLGIVDGRAALRRRSSNELVPLDECRIAHPLLEELIVDGRFGAAREVTLRVGVSSSMRLALVHGDASDVDLPSDVAVTSDGKNTWFDESVGGRTFRASAKSFFQSGPQAAELLSRTVDEAVMDDADWIVDAYAGIGVLGGIAAEKRDAILTSIEQNRSAVRDARRNLADLNAQITESEVAEMELTGMDTPDVIIADPSRSGLGPSATKALTSMRADEIVLVSCDPASLARDVRLLDDQGYHLDEVVVLDLFPHSHHVESVSTFRRG